MPLPAPRSLSDLRAMPTRTVLVVRKNIWASPRDGVIDGPPFLEKGTGARFICIVGAEVMVWIVRFIPNGARFFHGFSITVHAFYDTFDIVAEGEAVPSLTPPDAYWNGDEVYGHTTLMYERMVWQNVIDSHLVAFSDL